MIRLPDWAFARLTRVYRAQDRLRREELRRKVAEEDRRFRAQCDRDSARHDSGMCGGVVAGCRYYPCYSVRD